MPVVPDIKAMARLVVHNVEKPVRWEQIRFFKSIDESDGILPCNETAAICVRIGKQ